MYRDPDVDEDNVAYWHLTGPQRLDKELHTLEGLLRGIAIDGEINAEEVASIRAWIAVNSDFADRHPHNELIPILEEVLADGVVDDEERQDILWLCERLTTDNTFFNTVTSDMQRLHGILGGIAADGVVSENELRGLGQWLEGHEHLRAYWPYDEIESLVRDVMRDGVIDPEEQKKILAFFTEFCRYADHKAIELPLAEVDTPLSGVCDRSPEISFAGRVFCFTGRSKRGLRMELEAVVERLGGSCSDNVCQDVDYLVVGGDGNKAWAFACYGRKVELAIEMRKIGHRIRLVHESDFWRAVDAPAS